MLKPAHTQIAAHKCDGPTTCITFLGIEIDTVSGQLRLPCDKLDRLRLLLEEWRQRKHCDRKQLEFLNGLLNHACKVVRSGCFFLRRMIDLLHAVHHPHHSKVPIRLNKGFRSDLAGWSAFVGDWNGVSFLQTVKSYLSAVRNSQILLGLPDPRHQSSLPILKRVQAGIARLRML